MIEAEVPSRKNENYRFFDFKDHLDVPLSDLRENTSLVELHPIFENDYFAQQNIKHTTKSHRIDHSLGNDLNRFTLSQESGTFPNIEIHIPENRDANILIEKTSNPNQLSFVNDLIQIKIKRNSKLNLCILQNWPKDTSHVSRVVVDLDENAHIESTFIDLGGKKGQTRYESLCNGKRSFSKHRSLFLGEQNNQHDFWINSRNLADHTCSEVDHRVILKDRSEAVFNGNLMIPQSSLHTMGYHKNKNLLLSDEAILHTTPKLEISTNEVNCAHGASIAALDQEQIYYLMSRGLDRSEAELKLIRAFQIPTFEALSIEMKKIIQNHLENKFSEDTNDDFI